MAAPGSQPINLSTLPIQELASLRKTLEEVWGLSLRRITVILIINAL